MPKTQDCDLFDKKNFNTSCLSISDIFSAIRDDSNILNVLADKMSVSQEELDKFLVDNILLSPTKKVQHSAQTNTLTQECHKTAVVHTDGGSRGNPGEAGCGVVIEYGDGGKHGYYYYLGTKTNNEAEYTALIKALELLQNVKLEKVEIFADSELMCNQINGIYKVKNENLLQYYSRAVELMATFKQVSLTHVVRNLNKDADKMANVAMDKKSNGEIELTVAE